MLLLPPHTLLSLPAIRAVHQGQTLEARVLLEHRAQVAVGHPAEDVLDVGEHEVLADDVVGVGAEVVGQVRQLLDDDAAVVDGGLREVARSNSELSEKDYSPIRLVDHPIKVQLG